MSKTIWITRSGEGAAGTARAVERLGYTPIVAPVLETIQLEADLDIPFDAVIFTSRNGVRAFSRQSLRRDVTAWCVGDATAEAARIENFNQVISAGGAARDLFERLKDLPRDTRLLYAAAKSPSAPLSLWLNDALLHVTEVAVYDTIAVAPALSDANLGAITHILIHSARAGRAVATFLMQRPFSFTTFCFICISEQAWQGVAEIAGDQDIKRLIAAEPTEAAMLRFLGAGADM